MVDRRNRATNERFWGCSRYPACHGTRQVESIAAPRPTPSRPAQTLRTPTSRRPRLSLGGRPRSLPDYIELLVARRVGRTLGPMEGCIVQIVALLVFAALVWAAFASDLVTAIAEVFARWYTSVIHLGPAATP